MPHINNHISQYYFPHYYSYAIPTCKNQIFIEQDLTKYSITLETNYKNTIFNSAYYIYELIASNINSENPYAICKIDPKMTSRSQIKEVKLNLKEPNEGKEE